MNEHEEFSHALPPMKCNFSEEKHQSLHWIPRGDYRLESSTMAKYEEDEHSVGGYYLSSAVVPLTVLDHTDSMELGDTKVTERMTFTLWVSESLVCSQITNMADMADTPGIP